MPPLPILPKSKDGICLSKGIHIQISRRLYTRYT
jgi:hypothetical protein